MSLSVFCDFDGTIALEDVTDRLLESFALPSWREVEAHWLAGRIGSRECMARQVDLIRAVPAQLDRLIDCVTIDPDFAAFVRHVRGLGGTLVVVSDGLDYAIHRILARHGLDHLPVYANHLEFLGANRWRLAFPHALSACAKASGTCKCAVIHAAPARRSRILVGDGTSDFCAAGAVDMVLAKGKLARYCAERVIPHHPIDGFGHAARLIDPLASGPVSDRPRSSHMLETL